MIKKKFCLKGEKNFQRLFKQGEKVFNPFLGIYKLDNNLTFNRFAIIVSLKVDKHSTKRNLLKRRIKYIIKKEMDNFKSGFDILIITNPKTIGLSYKELRKNLLKLFHQAYLFKNDKKA